MEAKEGVVASEIRAFRKKPSILHWMGKKL